MQEYVSNAVVLRKESLRDQDRRYFLFTEKFGKMVGKAISARKITSKLAPHLEPGNVVKVRFVERNAVVVVDALKVGRLPGTRGAAIGSSELIDLHFLNEILPESQPEPELWELLTQEVFSWHSILRILGWDAEGAQCVHCGGVNAPYFYITRQEFFCRACATKLRSNEVILVSSSDAKI